MPIQDGFGDALSVDEEIIGRERLLRLKAGDRLRGNSNARDIWDDVLNEGRIVQWQVRQAHPDAAPEYISAAMTNRIRECISRGTWTGMETHRGRPQDPLRRPAATRSSVDDETLQLDLVVDSSDLVDEVLQGYHNGEIHQVLAALTFTQREYVVLRFWGGWTNLEIAARQGISKQTVERRWREDIRPHLVGKLAHLTSMV